MTGCFRWRLFQVAGGALSGTMKPVRPSAHSTRVPVLVAPVPEGMARQPLIAVGRPALLSGARRVHWRGVVAQPANTANTANASGRTSPRVVVRCRGARAVGFWCRMRPADGRTRVGRVSGGVRYRIAGLILLIPYAPFSWGKVKDTFRYKSGGGRILKRGGKRGTSGGGF